MFTDHSMIRVVHREGVILLGGGRALLMQIAHPAVAEGVAQHSGFREDRFGRLLRTLRPTLTIAFGSPEQAQRAVDSIRRAHGRVAGPGYCADDPALLLWVLGTLIDTAMLMHDRFVGPLPRDAREQYYRDMAGVGERLGIPAEQLPTDLAAFERDFAATLASLHVSDTARELTAELFRPSGTLGPAMPLLRELTAGLLPPSLRTQFGFEWDAGRDALLDATSRVSRRALPLLPPRLREPPAIVMPPRDERRDGRPDGCPVPSAHR